MATSWICPNCGRATTIQSQDYSYSTIQFKPSCKEGHIGITYDYTCCPNPECKSHELVVHHGIVLWDNDHYKMAKKLSSWRFFPRSNAAVFPSYVPQQIRQDYEEACLIAELSPKASATLARRCMQGILRDFWQVKPGNLANEIAQIQDKCDSLTWEAIDAVRKVGNIGAHMEKDVNVIVDVEQDEAQLLLELIETIVKDWYIARADRKARLEAVAGLVKAKAAAKTAGSGST